MIFTDESTPFLKLNIITMHNPPEPNDDLFDFPCDFPLKVMGETQADFDALVVSIVRRHCSDELPENAVKSRLSSNGKYTSVTVTLRAHSREQLDNLYRELSAHPSVRMVL